MSPEVPGGSCIATDPPEALLGRIALQDAAAFAAFYRQFSARVFGVVRKVVVNGPMSEEVTQEVFLEVWSKAASFDPARGSASNWILTISRRRAIDRVRSETASLGRTLAWVSAGHPTDYDCVLEEVLAQDETRQLGACLSRLSPLQREAIDLAYFGGLTYEEVARRLGSAPGTVKSRIRDGIIRLRSELTPA